MNSPRNWSGNTRWLVSDRLCYTFPRFAGHTLLALGKQQLDEVRLTVGRLGDGEPFHFYALVGGTIHSLFMGGRPFETESLASIHDANCLRQIIDEQ
jgi:hypothetical protein